MLAFSSPPGMAGLHREPDLLSWVVEWWWGSAAVGPPRCTCREDLKRAECTVPIARTSGSDEGVPRLMEPQPPPPGSRRGAAGSPGTPQMGRHQTLWRPGSCARTPFRAARSSTLQGSGLPRTSVWSPGPGLPSLSGHWTVSDSQSRGSPLP